MKTSSPIPIIITGTQVIERIDANRTTADRESSEYSTENLVCFGYKSLEITIQGITTPLSKDDDKFICYAETLDEARSTFWARWSQYVSKRFNRSFVHILKNT